MSLKKRISLSVSEVAEFTARIINNFFIIRDVTATDQIVRDVIEACCEVCFKTPVFNGLERRKIIWDALMTGLINECNFIMPKVNPMPTWYMPTIPSDYLEALSAYRYAPDKYYDALWYDVIEPTIVAQLMGSLESIAEQYRIELNSWLNMSYTLYYTQIIIEIGEDFRIEKFNELYAAGKIKL